MTKYTKLRLSIYNHRMYRFKYQNRNLKACIALFTVNGMTLKIYKEITHMISFLIFCRSTYVCLYDNFALLIIFFVCRFRHPICKYVLFFFLHHLRCKDWCSCTSLFHFYICTSTRIESSSNLTWLWTSSKFYLILIDMFWYYYLW